MTAQKKLYKDSKNKVFAGVAAGLVDYADMDVTVNASFGVGCNRFQWYSTGVNILYCGGDDNAG